MKAFRICAVALIIAIGIVGLCGCQNHHSDVQEKSEQSLNINSVGYMSQSLSETEENAFETILCREEKDKKTVYSFDNGKTWISEKEAEAQLSTLDVEWWTYEDFARYVDTQKEVYSKYAAEKAVGFIDGEYFVWDDAHVKEAIKQLEDDLEDIRNGEKISKIVSETMIDNSTVECCCLASDGNEEAAREYNYSVTLPDGTEHDIVANTKKDLIGKVEEYCKKLVNEGLTDNKTYEKIMKDIKS